MDQAIFQDSERRLALRGVDDALIMMVDDESTVIEITQAYLEEAGYKRFVSTCDPSSAIAMLLRERPDVLLCDVNMPRVTGFDILGAMKADPVLRYVSVIFLTSAEDAETKLKALELGATDFLRKPVDPSELALRLRNTLAAHAHREYLAHFDHVTGLPNRSRFVDELARALARSSGALLHFGLDRFRKVNEALGPAVGDALLQQAGQRIQREAAALASRPQFQSTMGSYAARLGGDEFCVLFPSLANLTDCARAAERLLRALREPYTLDGRELYVSASIGVGLFPGDGGDVETLMKNAGAALSKAKHAGGNLCRFYSKDSNAKALHGLTLEAELRKALEHGQLRLFLQPKVHIGMQRICGAEGLVRWLHPARGLISPAEFIPLAEECGLIVPIGEWALLDACSLNQAWAAQGLPRLPITVNVSPRQFHQSDLVQAVKQTIGATGQGEFLHLELTESSIMKDPSAAIRVLQELKWLGMKISLDDFGTGYSSLSYLDKLPLDELKIDRSFLQGIKSSGDEAVLVDLIIGIARKLDLTVVAEGVETREQLRYLASRGCDQIQGYLVSKPLSAEEFTAKYLKRL